MSNYSVIATWSLKDAFPGTNPLKTVSATELGNEFAAISTAITTKEDTVNKNVAGGYAALDNSLIVQGSGINVTGVTVPTVGLYRPTTNTLGFATNGQQWATVGASGNWLFNAPSAASPTIRAVGATGIPAFATDSVTGSSGMVWREVGVSKWTINSGDVGTGYFSIYNNNVSSNALYISPLGNFNFYAPASGACAVFNAAAGTYGLTIQASAGNGAGLQVCSNGGTVGVTDFLISQNGTNQAYLFNRSNAELFLGTNNLVRFTLSGAGGFYYTSATGGDKGLGTINAAGMYVNGVAVSTGGAPGGASATLQYNNGGAFGGCANLVFNNANNQFNINAATAAPTLIIAGAVNNWVQIINGASTSGQSFGLVINAGTTADTGFQVNNQSGATALFRVYGDGSVTVALPTGGTKGLGTINATGLFVNGVAVSTGGAPGGSSAMVQYNNGGAFGGFTLSGDATLVTSTGVITVTKTSGVAFATSATTDTTNAANISSGTIGTARLGSGAASSSVFLRGDQTWAAITSGNVSGLAASATTDTTNATNITSGTLGDARLTSNIPLKNATNAFTAGNQTTPSAVTFNASAMTINCALSNVFTCTFTGTVTVAPTVSNPGDGQTINFFITQDGTGSRTMTWPTSFKWPGGTVGVLSTAINAVDLVVATYRASTGFWYTSLSKGFA